jgi:hypothetical protein
MKTEFNAPMDTQHQGEMAKNERDACDMSSHQPAGRDGTVLSSTVTVPGGETTGDDPSENAFIENVRSGPSGQRISERSDTELSPQVSKSSKSIRLEPPPVVMRPPKVKEEGFSHAALSWLSWNRNEEKDISDCARSMRRSYTYRTTFRLFGFTLSKDINWKTSESGIDAAIGNIRIVSRTQRSTTARIYLLTSDGDSGLGKLRS